MMIIYNKKIPIYFGELTIVFNDNFNESLQKFKITYTDLEHCDGVSLVCVNSKLNRTKFIILLGSKTTHAVIAHEALHTTHRILEEIGQEPSFTNDEVECYLHDWIIKEVYTAVEKNKIEVFNSRKETICK